MLQMKKNTGAKVATLMASVAAAASIFGLVRQSAPASASAAPALVQANTSSSVSNSGTSAQTASTSSTQTKVTTRTHAS